MAEEVKTPAEQAAPAESKAEETQQAQQTEQKPAETPAESAAPSKPATPAEPSDKTKREMLLDMLKGDYPDEEFGDDEAIFAKIISKRDEDGKKMAFWKEYNDRLMADPKVATVLAELNAGTPFEVALAKYYDFENDFPKEGDTNYEKFAEARQARIDGKKAEDERKSKFDTNLRGTDERFVKWAESKGMDEQAAREWFKNGPYRYFQGMAEGDMPDDMFEVFWKAEQYDKDVEGARAAGEVAGRNQKIEEQMVQEGGDGLPSGKPEGETKPVEEKPKRRPYNPFIAESTEDYQG